MPHDSLVLAQMSDLHLDPDNPTSMARFEAARKALAADPPALIVLSGDLSHDGYLEPARFVKVRALLDTLPAPWAAIPGNHDVGNHRGVGDAEISAGHVARWKAVFGEDRFARELGGWKVLGINSLIAGSGMPEDQAQLDWLDRELAAAATRDQAVALFLHEPPYLEQPDERFGDVSDYWALQREARPAYLQRLSHPRVRLLAHGHTHWYRLTRLGHVPWVWCPPVSNTVFDARFPRGGEVVGYMRYRLTPQGQAQPRLCPLDLPADTYYFNALEAELPGQGRVFLPHVLLDFTGTLSKDGQLLEGVAERLHELAQRAHLTVLTADTFGKAAQALAGLPLELRLVPDGQAKLAFLTEIGPERTVAIGNGRNDVAMVAAAAVGIAIIGPEGAAGELLQAADVVTRDVRDALDLLLHPLRLKATLRD